jgi:hypothetical protein
MLHHRKTLSRVLALLWAFVVVGCASNHKIVVPEPIVVAPEPILVYNPCTPPVGNRFPDGPADPFHKGLAWNVKPTACI